MSEEARPGERGGERGGERREEEQGERYFWPPPAGVHPPYAVATYGSTARRAPSQPLVRVAPSLERGGPRFSTASWPERADLTRPPSAGMSGTGRRTSAASAGAAGSGAPASSGVSAATATSAASAASTASPLSSPSALGERIVVAGRVVDERGRPVRDAMIELWQANAAGRYHHPGDQHDAPLDPNFHGVGRVFTDDHGDYRFLSIKPGAYPWRNHANAWRPAHIHFSLFGDSWGARLVTQMYFPGDPLLALDPIFHSIPDEAARARLVSRFELGLTQPELALGYRFDVVLRGRFATPFEDAPRGAR